MSESVSREFPFKEYAWDDDLSNNNTWVDGAEAKAAYLTLERKLNLKEIQCEVMLETNDQLRDRNKTLMEAVENTIWNFENDCGRAGVEFLKEALVSIKKMDNRT
jgi:tryptophan 2,3-dioxygenase